MSVKMSFISVRLSACPECSRPGFRRTFRRCLCRSCYAIRQVRDRYRPFRFRDVYDDARTANIPDVPTDALPGTEAKIQVMCERARNHQLLFCPDDARA